jgi:hypothetical protein
MSEKVRVLYIAGFGRSGSTIISNLLGQLEDVFSGGELSWIWSRGILANEPCGCGKTFLECEVWKPIYEKGLFSLDTDEIKTIVATWKESIHTRRLATYMLRSSRWLSRQNVQNYLMTLEQLYLDIASFTGCNFIVDASKSPAYLFLLSQISSIELNIIHLIRDPRAVAFSWQRRKLRPETGRYMIQLDHRYSAAVWLAQNFFLEVMHSKMTDSGRYHRIRYEDFVKDPDGTIQNLSRIVPGFPSEGFKHSKIQPIRVTHSVSGNPVRFQSGGFQIRIDDEWMTSMKRSQKVIVSLITLPLLVRYGYLSTR